MSDSEYRILQLDMLQIVNPNVSHELVPNFV